VFDPKAMGNMKKIFGNRIRYGKDQYSILRGADALLILTDWNQFRRVDTLRLKRLMKKPVIFDGRNLLTPERVRHEKIQYVSIGRP
jgi:UDPglucose 6-dehydrogenase